MDCGYFVETGTQTPLAPVGTEEMEWTAELKGEMLKNSKVRSVNNNIPQVISNSF